MKSDIQLHYGNDVVRATDDDFVSLTDMWKAEGSPENKRPIDWSRGPVGSEFVAFIGENLKVGKSHVECFRVVRGGNDAGTWAHWQIALAYAKYLSPKFHAWCNTVVRERMQGSEARPSLSASRLADLTREVRELRDENAALAVKVELLDPAGTGVIGPTRANVWLMAPLRAAAKTAAKARGDESTASIRRIRADLEQQLRLHVHFPGTLAQSWELLPIGDLARAQGKVAELMARADRDMAYVTKRLNNPPPQLRLISEATTTKRTKSEV